MLAGALIVGLGGDKVIIYFDFPMEIFDYNFYFSQQPLELTKCQSIYIKILESVEILESSILLIFLSIN